MRSFLGLATLSSGVARGVAVLCVLVGNTGLLTPIDVLSECSLLAGRVRVRWFVERRKNISYY